MLDLTFLKIKATRNRIGHAGVERRIGCSPSGNGTES
jgi:hypothetical protein